MVSAVVGLLARLTKKAQYKRGAATEGRPYNYADWRKNPIIMTFEAKLQRTLSDEEKRRLKRSLPWFGKRRQDSLADIEQGLVDVYEFEVNRIWDINGCQPPCCPYTILFETTNELFVYIESWNEIERQENVTGENKLVIESTPVVKRLIKSRIEGPGPIKHNERLRELNEFFEINGEAEWRIFKKLEIPNEVATTLEAV